MARALPALALAALLGLSGSLREARASATVDLLFIGRNGTPTAVTNEVDALPTDTLTMAIFMRNAAVLSAATFSVVYDLDADDELDVVGAFEWTGVRVGPDPDDSFGPPTGVGPLPPTSTFAGRFRGVARTPSALLPPAGGTFAGGYQMGTVVWQVTPNVATDGIDIQSILGPQDGFLRLCVQRPALRAAQRRDGERRARARRRRAARPRPVRPRAPATPASRSGLSAPSMADTRAIETGTEFVTARAEDRVALIPAFVRLAGRALPLPLR
jgi:hypothetical protein